MVAEREPPVPSPKNTLSVSPWMYSMSFGWMPSLSATTCLNVVSWPWPWLMEPENICTVPPRSKRISAPSRPAAAARSMVFDMPSPRSLPRFLDSALRLPKPSHVGELQRQVHALLELAAVVGEGEAGLERHRLRRDVVLPAQLGRVHLQLRRRAIDHALDHVGGLRPAVAAIGPARLRVGEHRGRLHIHRRGPVDAGERAEVAGVGLEARLQVGAGVDERRHAEGEKSAVLVERELGVGDVVARHGVATGTPPSACSSISPAGRSSSRPAAPAAPRCRSPTSCRSCRRYRGRSRAPCAPAPSARAWQARRGRDGRAATWCRSCSGLRWRCSRRPSRAAPSRRW